MSSFLTSCLQDKLHRNEQRKQILDEITSRELTFAPQVNAKSKKLQVTQHNIWPYGPPPAIVSVDMERTVTTNDFAGENDAEANHPH